MTEPLSPSAQQLLEKFKREHGIKTFHNELWSASIRETELHFSTTELGCVRALCKHEGILCTL